MELLYFDFDHGLERLLFVRFEPESKLVHFRFEQGADPTHDEESSDNPTVSVSASTKCSSSGQFFGFCRAMVAAMRDTPFSLQDPKKRPFAAISPDALVLDGIGVGVAPEELTCRIPPEIVTELVGPDCMTERFKVLVGIQE